jgi:hypothetical protein
MFYRIHHLLPMLIKSIIYFKKEMTLFFFLLVCIVSVEPIYRDKFNYPWK